nr:hypothetical protein [Tanacetum cinerariifolium]
MSSSSSSSHTTVTYTCVSSDDDLPSWGIPFMEAYEPEAPLSLVYALEYPEYLAPSDDEIAPTEDQPLPPSPISLSPGYITDSEPIEDGPDEDPEMDPVDYAGNKEEEEEHLALADSALSVPDSVPSVEETKPFKTDESTATPPPLRSPQTVIPLPRTGLRMARKMRARITTPSQRFEIGESSAAAAARQPRSALLSWILRPPFMRSRRVWLIWLLGIGGIVRSSIRVTRKHRMIKPYYGIVFLQLRAEIRVLQAETYNNIGETVGHDAAYGMPWKTLMKMITDKYCPRSEIKKLEVEI